MKHVQLNSTKQLIKAFNELPNHFAFRGQADSDWELHSSLERVIGAEWDAKKAKKFEEHSLAEFKSKFHLYDRENAKPNSKLAWLAAMQHYGVPTRLIDFTTSPYVALYFAIESYQPQVKKDLAVFAIDHSATMNSSFQLLRDEVPGFAATPADHRERQDLIFDETVDVQSRNVVWITEPTELNKRLDLQSGCFVLSGNRERRLIELLDDNLYEAVDFFKYTITADLYMSIFALLRKMNINSKTLYGDLEGLARSIRMELQVYA